MARKNDSSQMKACLNPGSSADTEFNHEKEIKYSDASAREAQNLISFEDEEEEGMCGRKPLKTMHSCAASNRKQESGNASDVIYPPVQSQRSTARHVDGEVSDSQKSGIGNQHENVHGAKDFSEQLYEDPAGTLRGNGKRWDVNLTKDDGEPTTHTYSPERRKPVLDMCPPYKEKNVVTAGNGGGSDSLFLGEQIERLNKMNPNRHLPPLRPSAEHTVLVVVRTVKPGTIPTPFQSIRTDAWDRDHVKMPHSPHNKYDTSFSGMNNRWDIIEKALGKKLSTPSDIEKAIKSYNKKYEKLWKFNCLRSFFASLKDGVREYYLQSVIPKMARLALQLPKICCKPIPLLKRGHQHAITMSQQQAACLLANAFFCTFPHRNTTEGNSEFSTYPSINFNRLFDEETSSKKEKLRAIFCYFDQVLQQMRSGLVTFERRNCSGRVIDWSRSKASFTKLHVSCYGNIEENGKRMLQVDFASPIVGGGVLSAGLVQEEIRFLINTELIVSRLFTERLDTEESLIITGAEQYSCYDGYSRNFEWREAMKDETPRDSWQRRCIEIVAIDAIQFSDPKKQFTKASMERELNKAYSGFWINPRLQEDTAIATGNWGCGAFNGYPKLKALLQLMAAAEAGRAVAYFTFGDSSLMEELHEMHLFLEGNFSVGQLHTCLKNYCKGNRLENISSFYHDLKLKLTTMAKM